MLKQALCAVIVHSSQALLGELCELLDPLQQVGKSRASAVLHCPLWGVPAAADSIYKRSSTCCKC